MTVWKSRGLRGSALEDLILLTNEYYAKQKLGRVDKVSVPIKVIDMDKQGMITKAYFEKKSTVDFHGVIQGVGVAFDAKETALKSLPLKNIHSHQVEFMQDITEQKGLAFLIVHFKFCDEYYIITYEMLSHYMKLGDQGHRMSIPYKAMDPELKILRDRSGILNYLPALNVYMQYRTGKRLPPALD